MADDPRIDPADLRNVRFPGSSRRYDARSVDQFLETVAARIAATNVMIDELRRDLADAHAAALDPSTPTTAELSLLDDDALVRLVGEETANVLSTARRGAEEIRSKAEESAARMIREATAEADRLAEEARRHAAELTAEVEQVHARATAEAEEAAALIRQEATDAAERLLADQRAAAEAEEVAIEVRRVAAHAEAEAILEQAREEGRAMVAEAREVRARILDDLHRRRDAAREHIEILLAGRERLLTAYAEVRENLDDITCRLTDALPDADEPPLPDGFAGAVGTEVTLPAGGDDGVEGDDVVPAAPDGPDDTSASVAETSAEPEEVPPAIASADDPPVEEVTTGAVAPPVAPAESDEPIEGLEAEAQTAGDVDALFARLRAEREESVARAQQVLAGEDPDEALPAGAEPDEPPGPVVAEQGAPTRSERPGHPGATEPDSAGAGAELDRVPAELLADPEAIERRAQVLAPIRDALNRSLKRRLADEQNELLDTLRRLATTDPAVLLPEADEQVAAYAGVAGPHLAAVVAAAGGDGVPRHELATALGRALVEPFRRRVERACADVEDPDELDERLRALYREWKVQHVGAAAEDALLSAYARGVLVAAVDRPVRWRIDPGQGPCPDAQDNALAGAVVAGEAFPTGDLCPQAHPGCLCLLVVDGE